ncbi:hypothetical protein IWX75_001761 [Arthrobacter sp. CAN_A6]|uniref:hypothetical protein n=1 Tax=Arthrobacter sp. CAN_A6 TaxID=2787721 RepID=UPI0018CACC4B
MTHLRGSAQLRDLVATVEQLFPQSTIELGRARAGHAAFRLVPGPRRPRMIVPAASRNAAFDALSRPSAGDTFRTSAPRRLLAAALSGPLGSLLMPFGLNVSPGRDSILDYLGSVLGRDVLISLAAGSARANRKPVLNLHTTDGVELGFAKVGLSPLTNVLVRREFEALESFKVTPPESFQVPVPLHYGLWQDHPVLVMTALRPDGSGRGQVPVGVVAEIARSAPIRTTELATSTWFSALRRSVAGLVGTEDGQLPKLMERFAAEYGTTPLPFAASHGDFGPWNMALTSDRPMIWDWERFSPDRPLGTDAIHYLAHGVLRGIGDLEGARRILENDCDDAVVELLRTVGRQVPDRRIRVAIITAYLFDITARFTLDSRTPGGTAVRGLARWHQDLLADQLERSGSAVARSSSWSAA